MRPLDSSAPYGVEKGRDEGHTIGMAESVADPLPVA